jgi:hemolysin III
MRAFMQPTVPQHTFPRYTRGERIADAAIHAVGVGASAVAAAALVIAACGYLAPNAAVSAVVYGIGLLAVFCCSAGYHLVSRPRLKAILRRFDHAAIYVKIAATYTPFAVVKLGGAAGAALLAGVWAVASFGALAKLIAPGQFVKTAYVLYLALGWSCLLVLKPLVLALSATALTLLVLGGVLYTVGVAFHLWHRLPYHNAIWHAFVLAASTCHFIAIANALAT